MWFLKYRAEKRIGWIGIGVAFLIPALLQLIFDGGRLVQQIVAWALSVIGISILIWVLLKPVGNEMPPLEHSVKKSKVVWGLWFTGDTVTEENLLEKYQSIKRILLLDPQS